MHGTSGCDEFDIVLVGLCLLVSLPMKSGCRKLQDISNMSEKQIDGKPINPNISTFSFLPAPFHHKCPFH